MPLIVTPARSSASRLQSPGGFQICPDGTLSICGNGLPQACDYHGAADIYVKLHLAHPLDVRFTERTTMGSCEFTWASNSYGTSQFNWVDWYSRLVAVPQIPNGGNPMLPSRAWRWQGEPEIHELHTPLGDLPYRLRMRSDDFLLGLTRRTAADGGQYVVLSGKRLYYKLPLFFTEGELGKVARNSLYEGAHPTQCCPPWPGPPAEYQYTTMGLLPWQAVVVCEEPAIPGDPGSLPDGATVYPYDTLRQWAMNQSWMSPGGPGGEGSIVTVILSGVIWNYAPSDTALLSLYNRDTSLLHMIRSNPGSYLRLSIMYTGGNHMLTVAGPWTNFISFDNDSQIGSLHDLTPTDQDGSWEVVRNLTYRNRLGLEGYVGCAANLACVNYICAPWFPDPDNPDGEHFETVPTWIQLLHQAPTW